MNRSGSYLNVAPLVVVLGMLVLLVGGCPDKGAVVKTPESAAAESQSQKSDPARAPKEPSPGNEGSESAADAGNAFAFRLHQQLRSASGNLFYSPFSIATALGMAYAGAVGNTAAEMRKALGYRLSDQAVHESNRALLRTLVPASKDAPYVLHIANRLWIDKKLKLLAPFVDITRTYYGAAAQLVDYLEAPEAARATINRWVKEFTAGMIPRLLAPTDIDKLTRLVLTNAIYFKASWATKFKRSRTQNEPFFADSGKVNVPMMRQEADLPYARLGDLAAVELPYAGGALSMLILLPHAKDGLPALEQELSPRKLAEIDRALTARKARKVRVLLPRFEADQRLDLEVALSTLGMPTAFGNAADFFKMVGKVPREEELRISKVIHQAVCKVNEEGTEAAATTAVVMVPKGGPSPGLPPEFRADHPFVFAIRHRASGAMLFLGRLSQPTR